MTMAHATLPMLHITNLGKQYRKLRVLTDVSFDVAPGSVIALLGANGAGKTTTLKCILGVMPFDGAVEVDGISVRKHGKDARRRIGYVPQSAVLNDGDTCREALEFLAELKGAPRSRVDEMLALVNLGEQRDVAVGHLSGGMRQRLALAGALLADPPLLLLDEPTASLDIESRMEFHRLILRLRDEGKTIILSTHFFDHLEELASRVLILDSGRLAFDGSLDELSQRVRGRRYVVNLNGNAPARFMEALSAAGIGPDRVQPAEMRWEELLLAAAPERQKTAEEQA
ncbi:MAG: ABC transporter ATP-binding protein [Chloroflexi bacterium]|nr:ABC transporter ATP-binding protein [Chloroflexota bacterium]